MGEYSANVRKGGTGGAKTAKSGADFENSTSQELLTKLVSRGYQVTNFHNSAASAKTLHGVDLKSPKGHTLQIFYQDGLYKLFLEPKGIHWQRLFSARLRPDTAIFSEDTRILTIIEKKQQEGAGSVAEKLQTCDYKLMYYKQLTKSLEIEVQLVWQLGSYFAAQESNLKSVFEYMLSKGSKYFFYDIPLEHLNIGE